MKSIYKILPVFLLTASCFTSCEKEPEVGTPLFPEEEVEYGPKAYILEKRSVRNENKKVIEEKKEGLVVIEEVDSFYVRLNQPVSDKDIVVTVQYNQDAADTYKANYKGLGSEAIELMNSEVTIPAGQQISNPIIYKIVKNSTLESMEAKGVSAFKITNIKGANVGISKDYNTFYVLIEKNFNYLNPEMSFEGLEPMEVDQYIVRYGGEKHQEVSDGTLSTYIAANSMLELDIEFKEAIKLIGFDYQASSSYGGYSPRYAEVLISNDGKDYISCGKNDYGRSPYGNLVTVGLEEMSTKYLKLKFTRPGYLDYGPRYDTPLVGELHIYENK